MNCKCTKSTTGFLFSSKIMYMNHDKLHNLLNIDLNNVISCAHANSPGSLMTALHTCSGLAIFWKTLPYIPVKSFEAKTRNPNGPRAPLTDVCNEWWWHVASLRSLFIYIILLVCNWLQSNCRFLKLRSKTLLSQTLSSEWYLNICLQKKSDISDVMSVKIWWFAEFSSSLLDPKMEKKKSSNDPSSNNWLGNSTCCLRSLSTSAIDHCIICFQVYLAKDS